jgi:phosphoserine phosphatase
MSSSIVVSDLDGTLTAAETWRGVLGWVREHHPSPAARRFVGVRLPLVVLARAGVLDKEAFRARWFRDLGGLLAGLPERRLAEMAGAVVDDWLWPARREAALALVTQAVAATREVDPGARLVIATGAYQQIADAFANRAGADHALGTPLETVDGIVTGRLAAQVQTGEQKAAAVRALAGGADVVAAFGDTGADIPLLGLARRAVAIGPDADLRAAARRAGWEVVEVP